MTSSLFN